MTAPDRVEAAVERLQSFRGAIRVLATVFDERERFACYLRVSGTPAPQPGNELLDADLDAVLAAAERLGRMEQERVEDVRAARRERDQIQQKLDEANAALLLFVGRYGSQTFHERDMIRAGELRAAMEAQAEREAADLAARDLRAGQALAFVAAARAEATTYTAEVEALTPAGHYGPHCRTEYDPGCPACQTDLAARDEREAGR